VPSVQKLGKLFEARVYEIKEQNVCVAFLSNHNTKDDVTMTFRGQPYFVPRHSISILADCKTVVFSTQHVNKLSIVWSSEPMQWRLDSGH
jgi:hypothetical protein